MSDAPPDVKLGPVRWDEASGEWQCRVDLSPGATIGTSFDIPRREDPSEIVEVIRGRLEWLRSHEFEARRFVARELLADYNESWCDDEQMDEAAFVRRIVLSHASFGDDGSAILTYDDGNLFGRHSIVAAFDPTRGWWECALVG